MEKSAITSIKSFVVEGPWRSEPRVAMFMINLGWGNGYCILPEGHPYHGKHYDEIPCENQELTFAQSVKDCKHMKNVDQVADAGGWVIGFDTAHGWNNERHDKAYVTAETNKLAEEMLKAYDDVDETTNT